MILAISVISQEMRFQVMSCDFDYRYENDVALVTYDFNSLVVLIVFNFLSKIE